MELHPFDAARALLPAWAVWAPAIATVAAPVIVLGVGLLAWHLASRPLRSLPPDAHWSLRARLAFAARRDSLLAGLVTAALIVAAVPGGPLSRPPPPVRLPSPGSPRARRSSPRG